MVCNRDVAFDMGRIKVSELRLEMRLLHLIIVHSIHPKSGSFTKVGSFELMLMWMLIM